MQLLSTFLNQLKLVGALFGSSNMHSTLDFCPKTTKKETNVQLKVSKFQNENIKSSHFPKSERKNLKNSVLSIQGKIFQIFRPYFGQCDDFILSF